MKCDILTREDYGTCTFCWTVEICMQFQRQVYFQLYLCIWYNCAYIAHAYVCHVCLCMKVCVTVTCAEARGGHWVHCSITLFFESESLLNLELGWYPVSPGVILAPATLTVLGYSHRQPPCAFYECWGFELRSLYFFSKYSYPGRCLLSLIRYNFDVIIFHVFFLIEHFIHIFNVFCSSPFFPSFSPIPPRVPHHTLFQLHDFFYIFHNH